MQDVLPVLLIVQQAIRRGMPFTPGTDEACLKDSDDIGVRLQNRPHLFDMVQYPFPGRVGLGIGPGTEIIGKPGNDFEAEAADCGKSGGEVVQ
jgi:hypothetical protein